MHFINRNPNKDSIRTTEVELFGSVYEAEQHIEKEGGSGYITERLEEGLPLVLIRFFGGFEPSAQEMMSLMTLTQLTWDDISKKVEEQNSGDQG